MNINKNVGEKNEILVNRINQYEAEDFDDYMINIIIESFKSSLENIEYSDTIKKYMDELKLVIKLIYFSFKLINEKYTEGQQVYNVKFVLEENLRMKGKLKIVFYLLCKIFLPYLINKINDNLSKLEIINEDDSISWTRKFFNKFLIFLFKSFDLLLKISELGNFIIFIIRGKFPTIWNRIFNLEYEYINPTQSSSLSFNFLMKKIIWNQLAKVVLYFFNIGIGKSNLQSLFSQLMSIVSNTDDNQSSQKKIKCPICFKPVTLGYRSKSNQCEHVFCYFCITKYKQESELCPM